MTEDCDVAHLVAAGGVRRRRPPQVVDDEEIEEAVVVVVQPARGDGPFAAGDAGARRHVVESAVAAIAQQLVASHAGNEQIDVAVVVVVGGRDAHRVADAGHACLVSHVRETHVPLVAIQPIRIRGQPLLERGQLGAVGEEDVRSAVPVVIEDGEAARRTVDVEFFRPRSDEPYEAHACAGGDVAQMHTRRLLIQVVAAGGRRAGGAERGGRDHSTHSPTRTHAHRVK